jgi:hypothetical protein
MIELVFFDEPRVAYYIYAMLRTTLEIVILKSSLGDYRVLA